MGMFTSKEFFEKFPSMRAKITIPTGRIEVRESTVDVRSMVGNNGLIAGSVVAFFVDGPAIGKPRQTQRDKWANRPCVVAYRQWADKIRAACPSVPPAMTTKRVSVTAYYAPPKTWSKARREAEMGQPKRTKPDPDNILKGVLDALWKQDSAVGRVEISRIWSNYDRTHIVIETV